MMDTNKKKQKLTRDLHESHHSVADLKGKISQHEQTEQTLQESEEQFRALIESLPIAIVIYDGTKFLYINPAFEKITGYSRDELYQQDVWQTVHPEYKEIVREYVQQRLHGEPVPEVYTFKIITKSGEERWVERSAIDFELKKKSLVLVTGVDITKRKFVEEALHESEKRYRRIAENMSDLVSDVDAEGFFRYISPSHQRILGYRPEDLLGTAAFDKLHPDDKDWVSSVYMERVITKTDGEAEYRFRHADGHYVWLRSSGHIILDGTGKYLGSIINSSDITEHKQMEDELKESERKYRAILENASDAILLTDRQGNLIEANRTAEKLWGYTRKELLEMNYTQLHPMTELDRTIAAFKKIVKQGKGSFQNGVILCKDGTTAPVDITATAIDYNGEKGFQASFRDISGHKQIEETLDHLVRERTAELSKSNKQLTEEIAERQEAEAALKKKANELKLQSQKLQELNATLRVLLQQREQDRTELEEKVLSNVKHLLFPQLETLREQRLDAKGKMHLDILEGNLKNIVSSFSHRLSSKYTDLTPTEIRVANLIRGGKTTKEISKFLGSSDSAINIHRFHIRRKLGLIRKNINLQSHLSSIS